MYTCEYLYMFMWKWVFLFVWVFLCKYAYCICLPVGNLEYLYSRNITHLSSYFVLIFVFSLWFQITVIKILQNNAQLLFFFFCKGSSGPLVSKTNPLFYVLSSQVHTVCSTSRVTNRDLIPYNWSCQLFQSLFGAGYQT